MYIPWWGVVVIFLALIALIIAMIRLRLHKRELQHCIRRLEGISEEAFEEEQVQKRLDEIDGGE